MEKGAIRSEVRERLRRLTAAARERAGLAVRDRVAALPEFRRARAVLCYLALPDEVPTLPLAKEILGAGKTLVLCRVVRVPPSILSVRARGPLADPARLESFLPRGPYGIPEPPADSPPFDPALIDLAIVPGRAFSPALARLGRGAGYFDRFLPRLGRAVLLGLAFEEQIVDALPERPHDIRMDRVATPTRLIGLER